MPTWIAFVRLPALRATGLAEYLQQTCRIKGFVKAAIGKEFKKEAKDIRYRFDTRSDGSRINGGLHLQIGLQKGVTGTVQTHYVVITHEFGHMLGCPDEYTGINCTKVKEILSLDRLVPATIERLQLSDGSDAQKRLERQQTAFASHAEQAQVGTPYVVLDSGPVR